MQKCQAWRNPSAKTLRLMGDSLVLINDTFRHDIRCQSLFIEICKQPEGVGWALNAMHLYGVLPAYMPHLKRVSGLMQFDLFHLYTVDAHSIMVVMVLRKFFREDEQDFHPHAWDVARTHCRNRSSSI